MDWRRGEGRGGEMERRRRGEEEGGENRIKGDGGGQEESEGSWRG